MNSDLTALTLREILRQPRTWSDAVTAVSALEPRVRLLINETKPDLFLFTGCGTSYYLSIAAAGFFQEITGLCARPVPASELILSPGTSLPAGRKAVLFAFSRSGETTETVVASRVHRSRGSGPVIAIACRTGSRMEMEADLCIALPSADDRSVVMTSSFTTMLQAACLTAALLAGNDGLYRELAELPERLESQLEQQRAVGEMLGRDEALRRFIFLGIGPLFGLASEAMLKLKEMSQVPCETYSPLEFRHGPISIVEPGTAAVLLGSVRAAEQEQAVLANIRQLGGKALLLSGAPAGGPVDFAYSVGAGLSDTARSLMYMPLLQCLAYYRAMALGRDPDRPQHLTRVVTLDEAALVQR